MGNPECAMNATDLQGLLGANIDRMRKASGLTIEQLAELCEASPGHVTDIMRGRKWIGSGLLARIATALQVPVHVLFLDAQGGHSMHPTVMIGDFAQTVEQRVSAIIRDCAKEYTQKAAQSE